METTGRFLGLDVGRRRLGVAVSDPLGVLASPQGLIAVGADGGLGEVCALVERLAITRIVVGLPLSLAGDETEEAQHVRAWVEQLRRHVEVPIEMWDERLSTVAAERALLEGGMRREKRNQRRDAVAAALVLQSYLDAQKTSGAW